MVAKTQQLVNWLVTPTNKALVVTTATEPNVHIAVWFVTRCGCGKMLVAVFGRN